MSSFVFVAWTIDPACEPRPIIACSRCDAQRPFCSSNLFRLNANGKRLDAWLIYRCSHCDNAWNRVIFERRKINEIHPNLLSDLQTNDAALARRIAFDANDLKRRCGRIEGAPGTRARKRLVGGDLCEAEQIEISVSAPWPIELRLDRLLAMELSISRRRLQEMNARRLISAAPAARLRANVGDGMRIRIDLADDEDRRAIIAAAAGAAVDSASPPALMAACLR